MKKRISKRSKGDSSPAKLRVEVKYTPVSDAESRLRRAFDILLDSALNTNREDQPEKETPSGQAPAEDALTDGSEGNDSPEDASPPVLTLDPSLREGCPDTFGETAVQL